MPAALLAASTASKWFLAFMILATAANPMFLASRPATCMSPSLDAGLGLPLLWATVNFASMFARFLYFSTNVLFSVMDTSAATGHVAASAIEASRTRLNAKRLFIRIPLLAGC